MKPLLDKKAQAKWNANVTEAKQCVDYIRKATAHRMRVAELALECCHIMHGGLKKKDDVTIGKFAREIGLNRITLYDWIKTYKKVYSKLTADQKKIADNNYKHCYYTMRKVRNTVSDGNVEAVRAVFDEMSNGSYAGAFQEYLYQAKTILGSSHSEALPQVSEMAINQMIETLTDAIAGFNQHLARRQKKEA